MTGDLGFYVTRDLCQEGTDAHETHWGDTRGAKFADAARTVAALYERARRVADLAAALSAPTDRSLSCEQYLRLISDGKGGWTRSSYSNIGWVVAAPGDAEESAKVGRFTPAPVLRESVVTRTRQAVSTLVATPAEPVRHLAPQEGGGLACVFSSQAASTLVHEVFGHGLEPDEGGSLPLLGCTLPEALTISRPPSTLDAWVSTPRSTEARVVVAGGHVVGGWTQPEDCVAKLPWSKPLHRFASLSAEWHCHPWRTPPHHLRVDMLRGGRFNRRTRRVRLYPASNGTALVSPTGAEPVIVPHLTYAVDNVADWLCGPVAGPVTPLRTLCDKGGQRMPNLTVSGGMLLGPSVENYG